MSRSAAYPWSPRHAQNKLKAKGYPWTLAKSFPASCPVGPFADVAGLDLSDLHLSLEVGRRLERAGSGGGRHAHRPYRERLA